jgi:hypothetical protein
VNKFFTTMLKDYMSKNESRPNSEPSVKLFQLLETDLPLVSSVIIKMVWTQMNINPIKGYKYDYKFNAREKESSDYRHKQ